MYFEGIDLDTDKCKIMCNREISQVSKQEENGALQPKLINASFGLC